MIYIDCNRIKSSIDQESLLNTNTGPLSMNESRSKERGIAFEYAFDCDVFILQMRN